MEREDVGLIYPYRRDWESREEPFKGVTRSGNSREKRLLTNDIIIIINKNSEDNAKVLRNGMTSTRTQSPKITM